MISDAVVFVPVETLEQAQLMRTIRNECRDYMTKSSEYITEKQQELWFNSLDKSQIKMWIMYTVHHGVAFAPIGFGYCRRADRETYLTGGLLKDARGKGHGRTLFAHLLKEAKEFNAPVTLEVLNTNNVAANLYRSLGFVPYDTDERITKMEYVG